MMDVFVLSLGALFSAFGFAYTRICDRLQSVMGLERVRQKWTPVLSPDTRKNKRLETVWRFCHRQTDSR